MWPSCMQEVGVSIKQILPSNERFRRENERLRAKCAEAATERDGAEMRARVAGETVNSLMRRPSPMTDTQHETPAVKRTPKVGDKVRIIVRTDLTKYGEVGEVGTVTQVDSGRTAWVDGVGVDVPW